MMKYTGINPGLQSVPPAGPFHCEMRVRVPAHASPVASGATSGRVWGTLNESHQCEEFVEVVHLPEPGTIDERSFDPEAGNDSNLIQLHVAVHPSGDPLFIACWIIWAREPAAWASRT